MTITKTRQTFSIDAELYMKILHIKKVTGKNRSQILTDSCTENIEKEFQRCEKYLDKVHLDCG
jgi:TolB-like protein